MSSSPPATGPAGTDDEVRGWTSQADTDGDWRAVTESEAETRQTLAKGVKKKFEDKVAASVVEEGSECAHRGPSKQEHESIGLVGQNAAEKTSRNEQKTPVKISRNKTISSKKQTGAGVYNEFLGVYSSTQHSLAKRSRRRG